MLQTLCACLPLLLTAVEDEELDLADIKHKVYDYPLYCLAVSRPQAKHYKVEVAMKDAWRLSPAVGTDCPYAGSQVGGGGGFWREGRLNQLLDTNPAPSNLPPVQRPGFARGVG